MPERVLTILGCGNLGTPILRGLIDAPRDGSDTAAFSYAITCIQSPHSEKRLKEQFCDQIEAGKVVVTRGNNIESVAKAHVVILGVDPSVVEATLKEKGLIKALKSKLLISVVAGWTREDLEKVLGQHDAPLKDRIWIIRVLPNIAAQVAESLTTIEEPHPDTPRMYIDTTIGIFNCVGKTIRLPPHMMNAATAVGGSTPAFWAVICDALIDAAVAVGVPRPSAQTMIYQSMKGTAAILQSGVHPGLLKDQGTSPEGCTIGGLMVLEEAGVRGGVGRALREAVTIARLMGSREEDLHVNDTRR